MLQLRLLMLTTATLLAVGCGDKARNHDAPVAPTAGAVTNNAAPPYSEGQYVPGQQAQPPPAVAAPAKEYPAAQLDPYAGLDGMGQWVTIQDERFFVPDRSRMPEPNTWQPYQDGRWSYDGQRGWTWVSSDPWGWMTDHYGVWRHHRAHGWIWLPFRDMHYEPHGVSWFDDGDYIGWYPYNANYMQGYQLNDRYGFDDGYWRGRQTMFSAGVSIGGFNFGFTLVNRSDATFHNIRSRIIQDRRLIIGAAQRAHQPDRIFRVGPHPGGDFSRSHDFVQRYSHVRAPVGEARVIESRGGARFLQPFNGRAQPRIQTDPKFQDHDRPQAVPKHASPTAPTPNATPLAPPPNRSRREPPPTVGRVNRPPPPSPRPTAAPKPAAPPAPTVSEAPKPQQEAKPKGRHEDSRPAKPDPTKKQNEGDHSDRAHFDRPHPPGR